MDEYPNWVIAPAGAFWEACSQTILDVVLSKRSHWVFQEEALHRSFKIGDCPNDMCVHPVPEKNTNLKEQVKRERADF